MEDVNQDATPDSSTALTEAIASSPEVIQEAQQAQEAQNPTAEQGTQESEAPQDTEQNVPFHKHPRFKEVIDENRWLKQTLSQSIQNTQQNQPLQQPQTDPYQGMTAEERVFWQGIDQRIEVRASKIADERVKVLAPTIEAGRMEIARMREREFRVQHPDVKAGSEEEVYIAQKISQGYNSDDAYWAVMGPRGVRVAQSQVKQQVKQQFEAKKKANIGSSSSSVPVQSSGTTPKKSFREEFAANYDRLERGEQI